MAFEDYHQADRAEGACFELARGIVVSTPVPSPEHGGVVGRVTELFVLYDVAHRGVIRYRAGRADCRLSLPGLKSDRRPDQAVYFRPRPECPEVWLRWLPHIVVEVVAEDSEDRDYVEKREEYLRAGVREYWILDPGRRRMLVLLRAGDVWEEVPLGEDGVHRTELLPGLEARVGELLGPPEADEDD